MNIKKNIISISVIFIILFILLEIFSSIIINFRLFPYQTNIYYGMKKYTNNEFNNYLFERHELLGWPTKTYTKKYLNGFGARNSPNVKILNKKSSCISVYGDSFVFSADVKDKYAWANILTKKLNCAVLNYGIGGYGVDQSLLRFENNTNDNSQLIILGIYPEDLKRNLTHNYSLLYGNKDLEISNFKPRFILDKNKNLILSKIPLNSFDQYLKIKKNINYLENETFLPGNKNSLLVPSFPYSYIFLKSFYINIKKRVNSFSWLGILPEQRPFWIDNIKAVELNIKIIERFFSICKDRNKECRIIIFPDVTSLFYLDKTNININKLIYSNFASKNKIWDSTEWLLRNIKEDGICNFIGNNNDCDGHFNINGNEKISEFVFSNLMKNKTLLKESN